MMEYSKLAKEKLPYEGEFFLSKSKRFDELIFFVHFYDGSKRQVLRHVKLVNELGFDAFAFQLKFTHNDILNLNLPLSPNGKFGAKHIYADQIEHLLNLIPGAKIVFSFSNPSASAIEAMARRNCADTKALICDSGPTARFLPSAYNLYTHEYGLKSRLAKWALTPVLSMAWSPLLHKDMQRDLEKFPKGFQILSIRGWKDKLIPPSHIDEVFEGHAQLNWIKLSLPEAEHLTGLRDFKAEYVPAVERFLKEVATPLSK